MMNKLILSIICAGALALLTGCPGNKSSVPAQSGGSRTTADATVVPVNVDDDDDDPLEMNGWDDQDDIQVTKPTVVDFYADWCGPCKQLSPIMEMMEKKYQGQIEFRRYNIDEPQGKELADEFDVQGIPTLLFIDKKGYYKSSVGLIDKGRFESLITEMLGR